MVQVVNVWGSEEMIKEVAVLTTGGKTKKTTRAFISMLLQRGHVSPFEFAGATFLIETNIYTARQFMRHRLFSYMERSLRYVKLKEPEFNLERLNEEQEHQVKQLIYQAFDMYEKLIAEGVPAEVARQVLPLATTTQFYVSGNLRQWLHFLKLRKTEEAQQEIRQLAVKIENELRKYFPNVIELSNLYKFNGF